MSKTIWVVMETSYDTASDMTFTEAVKAFRTEDRAQYVAEMLRAKSKAHEEHIDKLREQDLECLEDVDQSYEDDNGEIVWYKVCSDKCQRCEVDSMENSFFSVFSYEQIELEE